MLLALCLSAFAMTVIVGVRYLITSGGFALATRMRHPRLYAGLEPQVAREIRWSLASAAIYGVPAGIVAWGWQNRGWTRVYDDVHAMPLWYLPVSVLVFLMAHDTWFYWTHRWMHRPRPFALAHAVHHASRPPTAWAAMAFHPIEALSGAVAIPLLVFAIPIHVAALGLVLTIMTVMGVTNHMGWEIFPRFMWTGALGGWLITASHHQRHHERYGCNYGLYFRFWDRLCGTDGASAISSATMRTPRAVTSGGVMARGGARLLAAVLAGSLSIGATPIARLDVAVDHLRSGKGLLRVCLTADPDNFPACVDDADAVTRSVPAGQHDVRFDGLPRGVYAVAVIHDENSNAKLDTLVGIPREGFGFSRNPVVRFGAPKFAAARFTLAGDAEMQQVLMRYIL